MARPAEFDRERALDVAQRLFWCQGYAATSLQVLLEAMAISRSSFYAAFGDKRTLFVEVLGRFAERTRSMIDRELCEAQPLEAIGRFFYDTLLSVPWQRAGRGCLMVNTILELAEVDAELSAKATTELARVEEIFEDCFHRAQALGLYPRERSAADLAAQVMILNQGLRVASRKSPPGKTSARRAREAMKRQIDLALTLLELPIPA